MRLKLILPLLAALALAACQSTPEDTGSSSGTGGAEEGVSDAVVSDDSLIVEEEPVTTVAAVDPSQPLPGSQEELVQRVGDRVFFGFDTAVLDPEARRTLDRQAEWLRLFPEVALVLEGHCDERGTREYNLALGERRAHAVREYLIAQGIAPSRLRTISYGKERPYALGHNDEAWALNRRSVSVID